jgi:hypothetical protein
VVSTSYVRYERCLSPTIYSNSLNASGITVSSQSFNFSAIVNYASSNQISITHNNQLLTNFSYNSVSGRVDKAVFLNPGLNTFVITATNACGTTTQTYIVNYTRECVNPIVNINSVANNSLVYNSDLAFSAQVLNLVNVSGISLSINGINIQNFNFNSSTGAVYGNFVLVPGVNTIVLRATNDCGTVTQTISVNYQTCNLPIISSINPATDISSVNTSNYNFEATITNLIGNQDVTLNLNGQSLSNFSFQSSTGKVNANFNLNLGSNILIVYAQNNCGSISKTFVIERLTCNAPAILLSNTVASGSTTTSSQYNLLGTVANVSSANGITVTLNGQVVSNIVFNATTGQISKTLTLSPGYNTIIVSAINTCGSISESYSINYLNCTAPTVSITAPSSLNSSVNNEAFTFSANVGNITQAQGVSVTLNGQAVTNYNFSSATGRVSGTLNLNSGSNTIVITATNPCGTVSETISVNFLNCKSPILNISSPVSINSTVSAEDFAVSANISNVTNPQGVTITLNGQIVSNGFTPTTGKVSALFKLISGQNTIVITVTNDCGTATQTITVNYNPVVTPPTPPVVEEKITICHYPPGNNGNPQTIEIPLSAWPAHQAHGDMEGPCVEIPNENGNNQNGNGNSGGNSENQNGNSGSGNNNSENGGNGSGNGENNGSGNNGNNGSGNGNGDGNRQQVEKPATKPATKPEITPPVKTETKEVKPDNTPKPPAPATPKGKGGG